MPADTVIITGLVISPLSVVGLCLHSKYLSSGDWKLRGSGLGGQHGPEEAGRASWGGRGSYAQPWWAVGGRVRSTGGLWCPGLSSWGERAAFAPLGVVWGPVSAQEVLLEGTACPRAGSFPCGDLHPLPPGWLGRWWEVGDEEEGYQPLSSAGGLAWVAKWQPRGYLLLAGGSWTVHPTASLWGSDWLAELVPLEVRSEPGQPGNPSG